MILVLAVCFLVGIVFGFIDMTPFAGILYPKRDFVLLGVPRDKQPPSAFDQRLAAGAAYPQAFNFSFNSQTLPNGYKTFFMASLFAKKPPEVLHIKKIAYEWEGGTGIFSRRKSYKLAPADRWFTNGEWYIGYVSQCFPAVNFSRVFKGKEPGDEFLFRLTIVYSFDDEPENTQVLEYNVEVREYEWLPPFFEW
jgi:hypothetical protein